MTDKIERSATQVRGFENNEMDFQLLRQLGAGAYGDRDELDRVMSCNDIQVFPWRLGSDFYLRTPRTRSAAARFSLDLFVNKQPRT